MFYVKIYEVGIVVKDEVLVLFDFIRFDIVLGVEFVMMML